MNRISVIENLRHLPFAPSAAMMPIPQDPADDDVESDNDLDVRIARKAFALSVILKALAKYNLIRTSTKCSHFQVW